MDFGRRTPRETDTSETGRRSTAIHRGAATALHHKPVNRYLDVMADSADSATDALHTNRAADAYALFRDAIRRSTLRSLFGPLMASDVQFFGHHLQALLTMVDGLPQKAALHQRLRTPAWRRAMRGRAKVDAHVYSEIARVRDGRSDAAEYVLGSFVQGHDDEGAPISDEEIRDQSVSLIAAGCETTSAAMAWAIYAMLSAPRVGESPPPTSSSTPAAPPRPISRS